jgi:hypothetical protein
MSRVPRPSWSVALWLLGYALLVGLTVAGFVNGRSWAVRELDTPQARREWEEWRKAARQDDGSQGPVQRRPPKSPEPPTLILLRDHFAAALSTAILFETALYGVIVFLARGVIRTQTRVGPRR